MAKAPENERSKRRLQPTGRGFLSRNTVRSNANSPRQVYNTSWNHAELRFGKTRHKRNNKSYTVCSKLYVLHNGKNRYLNMEVFLYYDTYAVLKLISTIFFSK